MRSLSLAAAFVFTALKRVNDPVPVIRRLFPALHFRPFIHVCSEGVAELGLPAAPRLPPGCLKTIKRPEAGSLLEITKGKDS